MTKTTPGSPLPEYENPPVIEVAIGVQFDPMSELQAPHFGLFWNQIRADYPKIEGQPPISRVIERFDELPPPETSQVEMLSAPPLPRVLYVDPTGCWLIQLQSDRLLQNWRKAGDSNSYPRFPKVYQRFTRSLELFRHFCADQSFAPPAINQLEVTYINHILAGEGWNAPRELRRVFRDLQWSDSHSFLPEPEGLAWKLAFLMPNQLGRLHVTIRQGIRKQDQRAVFLCELTARGMPSNSEDDAIADWFHLAREWIVRGFADLMSNEIQTEFWRRKQ